MAINYTELAKTLQRLERQFGGNLSRIYTGKAGSSIAPGQNFQCVVLDNTTASSQVELPVVVTLGVNYTQNANPGVNPLPKKATPSYLTSPPYVEENLRAWRANAFKVINSAFTSGSSLKAQSDEWLAAGARSKYPASHPLEMDSFHFVMANFSPWITSNSWAGTNTQDKADILLNPINFGSPINFGIWEHLIHLKQMLPNSAQWIGHGKDCFVHQHFKDFVSKHQVEHWILAPNLSYPYQYNNWYFPRL